MESLVARVRRRIASTIPVNPAVRLDDGPICTFTFDDCPVTALEHGGAHLAALGCAGTFFISSGLAQGPRHHSGPLMWESEIRSARAAGHEIGGHTFSHRSMPALSAAEIREEFEANQASLQGVLPDLHLASFAYPFGEVSITAKRLVADRFGVARGVRPGLNGKMVDLSELRAVHLFNPTFDGDEIARQVANAAKNRAWIVFQTHDIREEPTAWGCTPRQFDFALERVRKAGIEILSMRSALGRIMHRTPGGG